jgi:predicted Zn-dependent protease
MTLISRNLLMILLSALLLSASVGQASDLPRKRSKSDRDIKAIGHRTLVDSKLVWYSDAKDEDIGNKMAAAIESAVPIQRDAAINAYIDALAQRIAQNSDATIPITVQVIYVDYAQAFTVWGGHQYITRGLLLRLQNECELASIIARGVAHTALKTPAREQSRANLMQIASVPFIYAGVNSGNELAGPAAELGMLKFQRLDAFDDDYFGIQYLYKSGYDTDCFLSTQQHLQPIRPVGQTSRLFDPFPPFADRLVQLHKEINEILPKQANAIVSTSAFNEFMDHLRSLKPPDPDTPPKLRRADGLPELVRHDPSASE